MLNLLQVPATTLIEILAQTKKKKKGSYTLFTLPNFLVPKGIGFPLRINAEVYLFPFLFFFLTKNIIFGILTPIIIEYIKTHSLNGIFSDYTITHQKIPCKQ